VFVGGGVRGQVLQLWRELDQSTQQLLLVACAQLHQGQGVNGTAGGLSVDGSSDNVQEALAARLRPHRCAEVGRSRGWVVIRLGL
jgi:hypothetical protein